MSKNKITYTEAMAKRIQNWGEQDPRIHNAEMKRWRKKWAINHRLEELRKEIRAERISYSEIAELQSLVKYIEPGDVELLEWAGVCEHCGEYGGKHSDDACEPSRALDNYPNKEE